MVKKKKTKRKGMSAAFMRSINPHLKKKRKARKSQSLRSNTMVKRRKTTRRRSTAGNVKPMTALLGGGVYGALREKLSSLLAPVTQNIPLGTIGDEAALFLVANYLKKQKAIKPYAIAAMYIEAARIGEAVADGSAFSGIGSGSNNNGGGGFGAVTLG